jgi:shikimate kinase
MSVPRATRRILLVGFMGSGKTLVGQALARRLGWAFRDFDHEIRSRVGLPIPEIFRQHGEAHFRDMEREVGAKLLREEEVVLASGGGWPIGPGRLDDLPAGTVSVWLKVTAEEALRRVKEEGPTRPLLAVADPVARARELLREREVQYRRADFSLDASAGDPEELASRIAEMIPLNGWKGTSPTPV